MKKANVEARELAQYIHTFLDNYAPTQKTTSQHTLKSYNIALTLYIGFLSDVKSVSPENLSAGCFEQPVIEEWLTWLMKNRNCSPETCNLRLSSLRVFLKFLGSRDIKYLYLSNDATRIESRKTTKKNVQGMSREAVKALLAVPNPQTRTGKRDITFMVFLYGTAARLDELLDMKISQLHLNDQKPYAIIIGKGRKIRTLYLLPKAVAHVKSYLKEFHGNKPTPDDYVFYSRNTGKNGKITQPAIAKMLKKHAKAAHGICGDVPLGLHAHQFRHAKASHWLEDGMNIVQISFLLGHSNVQTTMIYLDITTDAELKAMATLEDENDAKVSKKWKSNSKDLSSFCGLKALAK
ncbi:tyrosine-type recombinase/integrase [Priestia megaterium]|uniref:tyrosine-type recombinase/integrase n=1 Tax=Priestia megaterium TaxID=1404 RepID=UPI00300336B0